MARKTQVILTDDTDGSEATGTVSFALDGVSYEIDLNDDNAQQMREQLSEWTSKARRVGGRRIPGTRECGFLKRCWQDSRLGEPERLRGQRTGPYSRRRSATRTPQRTDPAPTRRERRSTCYDYSWLVSRRAADGAADAALRCAAEALR